MLEEFKAGEAFWFCCGGQSESIFLGRCGAEDGMSRIQRIVVCLIWFGAVTAATFAVGQSGPGTAPSQKAAPPPPRFTPTPEQLAIQDASEKDHQRVMKELGIKELRSPVDNNIHSPHPVNYDESKANVYTNVPDALVMSNGDRVSTPEMWWKQRRPEIAELFDREIYGRTPANLPKVKWEVVKTEHEKNGDVEVITKTLAGHVDSSADPKINVTLELTLSTPADAKGPVPVVMELGFSKEFLAQLIKRFPQFAQQNQGPTWQQQALARGWGYAEYVPVSAQPDNGAGLTDGIIGLVNKGQPRKMEDWGVLKAWAWGASRCLDYFETDGAVDAKQVGIAGHSRYGKTSLVAMAYDSRFAIGFISSSGSAGAKLYRHVFGEEVENTAGRDAYHWMGENFLKYAGPLNTGDLPVDANELIALAAPRPVFIGAGAIDGDGWVDPKGSFLAAVGASPVYKLLEKNGLTSTEFPAVETALLGGDIGFRQHMAGHTPGPNWPYFLAFAAKYFHTNSQGAEDRAAQLDLVTAEEDRERLLGLVGLKESQMRPRPDGDAKSPHSTNYDLAKANVYPKLPDPLVFKDRRPVKSAADWAERAKEIRADFNKEILGRTPESLPPVKWHVLVERKETYGGVDVVTKLLSGEAGPWEGSGSQIHIELLLTTPANAKGPVPVIMELAFDGDFEKATSVPLENFAPLPWGVDGKLVVQHGWGFAILNPASFQKDDGSGLTSGIIGLVNHGKPRSAEDWGALKAWAWGAHEALRYFETDSAVDAKQVGLAGHSRFGKAVLVTMAYYSEFAIGYSSSSGEGGAKLYRHIYGETIPNLAGPSLYHWFDGEFLRYAGPLNAGDLPVDNHELIALSAPRPLFITGGSDAGDGYANPNGDAWADTHGMFLAEVAAGPVYRLMGAKDLGTSEFPKIGTALSSGDLGFQQHDGGHLAEPSWPYFLEFASRYLHMPGAAR